MGCRIRLSEIQIPDLLLTMLGRSFLSFPSAEWENTIFIIGLSAYILSIIITVIKKFEQYPAECSKKE